jgi:hypothetical protein
MSDRCQTGPWELAQVQACERDAGWLTWSGFASSTREPDVESLEILQRIRLHFLIKLQ